MNETTDPPDVAAFTALVLAQRPAMLRWGRRWLGEDGEDCYQEAALRAWRYWPPATEANVTAWLWRVFRTVAVTWHRRTARQARLHREHAVPPWPSALGPALGEAVNSMEHLLSPVEYAALWDYAVLGYSHAEMTQRTGQAYMTSMTRVHRARQRLGH